MFFAPSVPQITVVDVDDLLAAGALLIDVREPSEWSLGRIPGARLRPLSTINDWYQDLPRDRTIVVACRTGSRSARVVEALIEQAGFESVTNLAGGIVAWAQAGFPIEADEATPD